MYLKMMRFQVVLNTKYKLRPSLETNGYQNHNQNYDYAFLNVDINIFFFYLY